MTQLKRICGIGAIVLLILLPTVLSTHALASPSITSCAPVKIVRDQSLSQAWLVEQGTGAVTVRATVRALAMEVPIAQNEIPNVLVPSTIPSAEPSFPEASPTPQQATVSINTTNSTAPTSAGNGADISKVIGSISPYFIIALIPLLFVIGALFYFFFMGDQDRGAPSDEKEANVQFSDADEDTEWRELE